MTTYIGGYFDTLGAAIGRPRLPLLTKERTCRGRCPHRPGRMHRFTGIFGEFAASQRAGRAAGPCRTPANPYCPANFDCKADLPQQFKRNYLQIRCTVTGGAYHSARRVSPCVRNICKSDSCLNRTAGCTPRPQAPLFSPFFSGKTEKNGPSETSRSIIFP